MKRKSRLMVLAGLLAFVMVGCLTARGGGWITSALDPTAKATFGFNLVCNPKTNTVQGQLEYQDHGGPGIAIHGFIPTKTPLPDGDTCASLDTQLPPGITVFTGTYVPQVDGLDVDCNTNPGDCGTFAVLTAATLTTCDGGAALLIA